MGAAQALGTRMKTGCAMTNAEWRMTEGIVRVRDARFIIRHSSSVIFNQPASFRRRLRGVGLCGFCAMLLAVMILGACVSAE